VSKSAAASLKLGVSGWQEESRGESTLSMVMETGLGNPDEVVWAGFTVSGVERKDSRSAAGTRPSEENSTPPGYLACHALSSALMWAIFRRAAWRSASSLSFSIWMCSYSCRLRSRELWAARRLRLTRSMRRCSFSSSVLARLRGGRLVLGSEHLPPRLPLLHGLAIGVGRRRGWRGL
jgi:hypothetical protein